MFWKSVLFIILICTFAIIAVTNKDSKNMSELRIAYNYFESAENLDPANIQTLYQANLIENLYSRLIDYDSSGQIICVLCEKFWLENEYLFFEIKKGIKTQNGYEISVLDVQTSLKRLFDLNSNTHGNLLNFVKDKSDIEIKDDSVKIKLIKKHFSQFFLPLIASMDFSIIPIISINNDNKIIDHLNTTGAYYLKKDDINGHLVLNANLNNPSYSHEMYKTVKIIPTETKDSVDVFLANQVDVIDITMYPRYNIYEKLFSQTEKKFNFHKTIPINLFLFSINPSANKKFTQKQLFKALSTVEERYLAFKTYGYGFERGVEFFPKNGNGHLSSDQKTKIETLRSSQPVTFEEPITLGVLKSSFAKVIEAFKSNPEIKIVSYDEDPSFLPLSQRPDIIVHTTDSSFNEDVSLLSYNFSMGYFGKTKLESDKWMQDYLNIEDKAERINRLQELQYDLLRQPHIFTVGSSPYWAISNDNIELNFSSLFPGSHWWKIRRK